MAAKHRVRADHGAINARLLARQASADFRHVEAASVKITTRFVSAEAKRIVVRYFPSYQLSGYYVSIIARRTLPADVIVRAEQWLNVKLDAAAAALQRALDHADAMLRAHGIVQLATYDTVPLELELGVLSSRARRYSELIQQVDLLMPMLFTLEVYELIDDVEFARRSHAAWREVRKLAIQARALARDMRTRVHAAALAAPGAPAMPAGGVQTSASEGAPIAKTSPIAAPEATNAAALVAPLADAAGQPAP